MQLCRYHCGIPPHLGELLKWIPQFFMGGENNPCHIFSIFILIYLILFHKHIQNQTKRNMSWEGLDSATVMTLLCLLW